VLVAEVALKLLAPALRMPTNRVASGSCFTSRVAASACVGTTEERERRGQVKALGASALSDVSLGPSHDLVGEEGEAVTDCPCVEEAHRVHVAGLPEQALAGTEHDREDDQSQLVGQAVLD
jgi:hypothetical protein